MQPMLETIFAVETPIRLSKLIHLFYQNNHNNEPQRLFINSLLKCNVFLSSINIEIESSNYREAVSPGNEV